MKAPSLLKEVQRAEKVVSRELEQLQQESAARILECKTKVRKKVKETLDEDPQQRLVRENIEHLQLRLELLRNMRMNWKNFEKYASERGIELRINQFSALQHLIHFLETGEGEEVTEDADPVRALMAFEVQPTGAGKTGAFAIETALLDVPTLILVPFDNLVEQTKEDLMKIGGIAEEDIGLLYGGTKEFGRKVTVATYAGHAAQMRRRGEYADYIQNNIKYCICDEVHTSLGDRTQESLLSIDGIENGNLSAEEIEALKSEEYVLAHLDEQVSQKALKVGFTATPKASAKHVNQYFPHFLGRVYHKDMVEAGILVPYRIVQCDGSVSEGEIGGYVTQELEVKILKREKIYEKLLGEYAEALHTYQTMKRKNEYPLRGMAFCTNHAECEKFVKEAQELGLRCEIVTGKEASGKKGKDIINAAKEKICAGEIDLIVTVEKLCAGFNFPEINAVIWARVTSMAKTIQGIGRGGRSYKEGKMKKDCCWVFETNWALKKNAKKGKKPLRIADALAENGEDPRGICSMADGSPLNVEHNLVLNENGIVLIDGREAIGVRAYSLVQVPPIDTQTLTGYIKKANLKSIKGVRVLGGTRPVNDIYWRDEVDPLIPKRLIEGVININGRDAIAINAYASASNSLIGYSTLLRLIKEAKLQQIPTVSKINGADLYWKDEVDALLPRRLNEKGIVNINGRDAVGLNAYSSSLEEPLRQGTLEQQVQKFQLENVPDVKILGGNNPVKVYWKDEVDLLMPKFLNENGIVLIDGREAIGIQIYSEQRKPPVNRQGLNEYIGKAGLQIVPNVCIYSRTKPVDVYWRDEVEEAISKYRRKDKL